MENLISEILPNADVEKLISRSQGSPRDYERRISVESDVPIKTEPDESLSPVLSDKPVTSVGHRPVLPNEEVPDEADGFDWIEEELKGNELTDGMAALSINPQGTGYFGLASSSVLLRALRVTSWDVPLTPVMGDNMDDFFRSDFLASKMICDTMVDAFFKFYNSSYPLIHEPTYRAQYEGIIPRPREDCWELLHNSVLALGCWCINHENNNSDLIFYQQARSKLTSSILETGNLSLVQALTLLSNYVQKRNKPNTGWNYLGLAIRMALGLGLYREFPNWKSSPLKLEMRRRVWWVLYIFDAGAAVTFGRPINLPGPELVDVAMPMNIHNESLTPATTSKPAELDGPTEYSGIITQAKFCLLTNGIYNRLISRPKVSAEESLEYNKKIEDFLANLPPYFKTIDQPLDTIDTTSQWFMLTQYRLLWRVKNFQVIMFRPFVLQHVLVVGDAPLPADLNNSDAERECRRVCIQSARETINLVIKFLDTFEHTSIAVWYALYFLFQASLIPIICLTSEPGSEHSGEWLDDVRRTKECLLSLTNQNKLAARFYSVIERLSEQYLATDLTQQPELRNEWMSDIYSLVYDYSKPLGDDFDFPDDPIIM